MTDTEILLTIQKEVANLSKQVTDLTKEVSILKSRTLVTDKWIRRIDVAEWLDYGDTRMGILETDPGLTVSKIGIRKFYEKQSFEKLLSNHIVGNW